MTDAKRCDMTTLMKISLLSIVLLISTTVACSGGRRGPRLDYKQYCADNYDPLPMNIDKAVKLELNIDNLPPGIYTFQGADFYMVDTRPGDKKTIKVHVREFLSKDGKATEGSSVCSRGLKAGIVVEHQTAGIAKIEKDLTGKFDVEVRDFYFRIDPSGFERKFKPGEKLSGEPPSKVYEGKPQAQTEFALFKKENNEFEIRAIDRFADGVTYFLATRLVRKDLEPVNSVPIDPARRVE